VSAPVVTGTFDVVGTRRAVSYFGSIDEQRLAHGYLFSGPEGVGKKTFARRLAQSLLCDEPKPGLLGYDGTCKACTMFRAGSHPDYHESIGAIKIGARDGDAEEHSARGMVRDLSMRPYVARWRVAVLGDVDFSGTQDAANALLKLLEEPPQGVLFLLTTDAPRGLLPTIRSRMIEIPFDPLPRDEVAAALEHEGVEPEQARVAAAGSFGSITRAHALLQGEESGMREGAIAWFLDAVAGRETDQSFLRMDDKGLTAAERTDLLRDMLEIVRALTRDWAALTVAGGGIPLLAADARDRIAALPKRSPAEIARALEAVSRAVQLSQSGVVNLYPRTLVLDGLRMELAG
jgi:DNA polymerase-3 subunit delta'